MLGVAGNTQEVSRAKNLTVRAEADEGATSVSEPVRFTVRAAQGIEPSLLVRP